MIFVSGTPSAAKYFSTAFIIGGGRIDKRFSALRALIF